MITLMGIILAVSVFVIASIASEMENIELIVKSDESTYLKYDFNMIKETFGTSLNYNLIDVKIDTDSDQCSMLGNINNITTAFKQTLKDYYRLELSYGRIFDAKLNRYWSVNPQKGTYYVDITLYLEDYEGFVTENVVYSIVCESK